jgi:hypothetical protein
MSLVAAKLNLKIYILKGRLRTSSASFLSLLGRECGASITWMAAGEASVDICSLLGLGMVCVLRVHLAG